jgi:hypothetical protein
MASTTNVWVDHTKHFSESTGMTYKESLKDHDNAASYYTKKIRKNKNMSPAMKEAGQEICLDMISLNAVNKQNTKGGTEHHLNDKTIKKNREFIKSVLNNETYQTKVATPKEPKPPKVVKPKEPKPVKAKAPKEPKPPKVVKPK